MPNTGTDPDFWFDWKWAFDSLGIHEEKSLADDNGQRALNTKIAAFSVLTLDVFSEGIQHFDLIKLASEIWDGCYTNECDI